MKTSAIAPEESGHENSVRKLTSAVFLFAPGSSDALPGQPSRRLRQERSQQVKAY